MLVRLDLTISNQKGTPARNPSAELKLEEGAKTRGVEGEEKNELSLLQPKKTLK